MTYPELINSEQFKELERLQNLRFPNKDILTTCGFMVGLPDAWQRLDKHLAACKKY